MRMFGAKVQAYSVGEAWRSALENVMNFGAVSNPRGYKTVELLGQQILINDMCSNILVCPIRDLNYRFMVAEWAWICAGREDVAWITKYNKAIAQFSDDGQIFNGAYGPRLMKQWQYIIETLRKPDSRQAVSVIFSPAPPDSKDIPCTISFQFLIREKKLHMIATMRSSDMWLGLPYDIFNFSMIGNCMAGELGVEPGSLLMQLGSMHLYENNWEKAKQIVEVGSISTLSSPHLHILPITGELMHPDKARNLPAYFHPYWEILNKAKTKEEALRILYDASNLK